MAKLIWNAINGQSLWSTYAKSRFLKSPFSEVTKAFPSTISKEVYTVAKNRILQNSRWVLGDGKDIDILRHKWVGSAPLISLLPTLSQQPHFSVKDVADQADHPLKSHATIHLVMENINLSNTPDICVWMNNANNIFSTSSAYQAIRLHGVHRPALLNIWHHAFNPRASIFGWRILHRVVPTDDHLSDYGIQLASYCSCCKNPSVEDLDHLFLTGELATLLWHWVSPLVHDKVVGNPGPCGSGGCIRDTNGDIHLGFAFYYGQGNSMLAKVRALCDGLRLADYHGLPISIVHSDSLALVHSINSKVCPSWKCTWWWRIAKSFFSKTDIKLVHAYWETNRVEDALASYACDRGGNSVFRSRSSLPSVCKGSILFDKSGLPSIRSPEQRVGKKAGECCGFRFLFWGAILGTQSLGILRHRRSSRRRQLGSGRGGGSGRPRSLEFLVVLVVFEAWGGLGELASGKVGCSWAEGGVHEEMKRAREDGYMASQIKRPNSSRGHALLGRLLSLPVTFSTSAAPSAQLPFDLASGGRVLPLCFFYGTSLEKSKKGKDLPHSVSESDFFPWPGEADGRKGRSHFLRAQSSQWWRRPRSVGRRTPTWLPSPSARVDHDRCWKADAGIGKLRRAKSPPTPKLRRAPSTCSSRRHRHRLCSCFRCRTGEGLGSLLGFVREAHSPPYFLPGLCSREPVLVFVLSVSCRLWSAALAMLYISLDIFLTLPGLRIRGWRLKGQLNYGILIIPIRVFHELHPNSPEARLSLCQPLRPSRLRPFPTTPLPLRPSFSSPYLFLVLSGTLTTCPLSPLLLSRRRIGAVRRRLDSSPLHLADSRRIGSGNSKAANTGEITTLMSSSPDSEEQPAILQLQRWCQFRPKLSDVHQVFISPTRKILVLLSYQYEALLVSLEKESSDRFCEGFWEPRTSKFSQQETACSCLVDSEENVARSTVPEGTECIGFSHHSNSCTEQLAVICDVKSLAWVRCEDTYDQHGGSIFREVLVVSGDHSITVHAFSHFDAVSQEIDSLLKTETLHGNWVDWGPHHNDQTKNNFNSDSKDGGFCDTCDVTSNETDQHVHHGVKISKSEAFCTKSNWLRTFHIEVDPCEAEGDFVIRFPVRSSVPHSAKVVSFSIFDRILNFLESRACKESHTCKENHACDDVSESPVSMSVYEDPGSYVQPNSSITESKSPTTEVHECDFDGFACKLYQCPRVFSSSSNHYIGIVLASDRDSLGSASSKSILLPKTFVIILVVSHSGMQWVCSVDLQEFCPKSSTVLEWVDFQFLHDFVVCLNVSGLVYICDAKTGSLVLWVDVLQNCDVPLKVNSELDQRIYPLKGNSSVVMENSAGEFEINDFNRKGSCSENHVATKRIFRKLLVTSFSQPLAAMDEHGVIYLISLDDCKLEKNGSCKFVPSFEHFGIGMFASWKVAALEISRQKAFSECLSDLSLNSACSDGNFLNTNSIAGNKKWQYTQFKQGQMIPYSSSFSAYSHIDSCKLCHCKLPSTYSRRVFLPTNKFNVDDAVCFSPSGIIRLVRSSRNKTQVVYTCLHAASSAFDERNLNNGLHSRWFSSFSKESVLDSEAIGCCLQGFLYLVTQEGLSVVLPSFSVSSNVMERESISCWQSQITGMCQTETTLRRKGFRDILRPWQLEVLDRTLLYEGAGEADELCSGN
ncbi:hypothetical protein Taro_033955, partial [Colocasia esculenta]|nr:hypothetical protein [Colocasia esculenta]